MAPIEISEREADADRRVRPRIAESTEAVESVDSPAVVKSDINSVLATLSGEAVKPSPDEEALLAAAEAAGAMSDTNPELLAAEAAVLAAATRTTSQEKPDNALNWTAAKRTTISSPAPEQAASLQAAQSPAGAAVSSNSPAVAGP